MVFTTDSTFEVSENIVFRKQNENAVVLLEIEGENLHNLEDVSAFIWNLIADDSYTYGEILECLDNEYSDFSELEKLQVDEFLDDLLAKKIISIK